ncbi:hypothetical protein SAMN05660895_2067 [Thermoflavifilum thermophilum]|uniref:Uncharacterized protein n=2 Tax=Thermoflavifilum thermophilum TaxID=1393122 RepID=A0A1I7NJ61_9BACT|nr:hypothetical protein SAMN05660895_2067 [Thermoflavifilum thermophilum]
MSTHDFKEKLMQWRSKAQQAKHPFELKQQLMHFFSVADDKFIIAKIDKKLLDDLCAVYYSIQSIEAFPDSHVREYLFRICIDRTLIIFEEMVQHCDN